MLNQTLNQIDQANLQDPNQDDFEGQKQPKEWVYSQHMTRWLFALQKSPSELVQIACRAQHLERWKLPRDTYPLGKKGYYQWRQACSAMHGKRAGEIMAAVGYSPSDCAQVESIISKRALKTDANTQLLEDVACLVFLEKYFAEFYQQNKNYDAEKWQRIVSRTWSKMSEQAQAEALKLAASLPEHLQELLQAAIAL